MDEDLERIRNGLRELVSDDPDLLDVPPPRVVVSEPGDYTNPIQLHAWLDDERRHGEKRAELWERVYAALQEAEVDMPFQTIQLQPLEVRRVA